MKITHIFAVIEHDGPCIKAFPKGGGDPVHIDLEPVHVLQLIKQLAYLAWGGYDLVVRDVPQKSPPQL